MYHSISNIKIQWIKTKIHELFINIQKKDPEIIDFTKISGSENSAGSGT